MELVFCKVNEKVSILANTLYNLHSCIGESEILHVNTHEWKYNNIMNSSIFFS